MTHRLARPPQLVDEALGPATKREYGVAMVPSGDALVGRTVDFMGRPAGAQGASFILYPLCIYSSKRWSGAPWISWGGRRGRKVLPLFRTFSVPSLYVF